MIIYVCLHTRSSALGVQTHVSVRVFVCVCVCASNRELTLAHMQSALYPTGRKQRFENCHLVDLLRLNFQIRTARNFFNIDFSFPYSHFRANSIAYINEVLPRRTSPSPPTLIKKRKKRHFKFKLIGYRTAAFPSL